MDTAVTMSVELWSTWKAAMKMMASLESWTSFKRRSKSQRTTLETVKKSVTGDKSDRVTIFFQKFRGNRSLQRPNLQTSDFNDPRKGC